jgi:hypothetical protein
MTPVEEARERFVIGDKVKAVAPDKLACGSGIYPHAIVVHVDPLVLVSPMGDMVWSATVGSMNLERCGTAEWHEYYAAIGRYVCDLRLPNNNWESLLARSACDGDGERWRKAEPNQVFYDGDQLLVAVPVNCRHGGKPYWEYSVVTVSCDSEHFSMDTHDNGWGWEWSDVEWWMPLSSYKLPVIAIDAAISQTKGE